ncbi:hypothetical protein [Enterobacter hormaechei]|uniref:hypothetical protein n=1 Tax=Enterobacter hormaechei TaxID=158836 RepID=UPI00201787E3|nr:hypothetical protein [Enterobacter hormaechei]
MVEPSQVHIGHHRNMLENKRHLRRIYQLLARIVFYRHAFGPHFTGAFSVVSNS